ncbi:MAG: hypothetical protein R3C39_02715 [Dehalococcoidia bacterium]
MFDQPWLDEHWNSPVRQMGRNLAVAIRLGWPLAARILGAAVLVPIGLDAAGVPDVDFGRVLVWGFVAAVVSLIWRGRRPDARQAGRRQMSRGEAVLPMLVVALLSFPIALGVMALGRVILPS